MCDIIHGDTGDDETYAFGLVTSSKGTRLWRYTGLTEDSERLQWRCNDGHAEQEQGNLIQV